MFQNEAALIRGFLCALFGTHVNYMVRAEWYDCREQQADFSPQSVGYAIFKYCNLFVFNQLQQAVFNLRSMVPDFQL